MLVVFISSISMCYVAGSSRYFQKRKSNSILSKQNCHCLFTYLFSPWVSSSRSAESGSDSSSGQDTQPKTWHGINAQCICWYQTADASSSLSSSLSFGEGRVTRGPPALRLYLSFPTLSLSTQILQRGELRAWMIPVIIETLSFDSGWITWASSKCKPKALMHYW